MVSRTQCNTQDAEMKANEALTAERVRELLSYNPDTGEFLWLVSGRGVAAGRIAGGLHCDGYRSICVKNKVYMAHRLAFLYVYGRWPANEIDHINGARSDNRIANLREATASENQGNQRKARSNSTTGFLGVSWYKPNGKFRASIALNGKIKHLGYFTTAEESYAAYLKAKRELHSHCTI